MHFKCIVHPSSSLCVIFQTRKYEKQTEVPYHFDFQLNVTWACFTIKVSSETFMEVGFWVWRTAAKWLLSLAHSRKWFAHLCDSESLQVWFPQSKNRTKKVCFLFDPATLCPKKRSFFSILSIQKSVYSFRSHISKNAYVLFDPKYPKKRAFFSISYFQKCVRSFRS